MELVPVLLLQSSSKTVLGRVCCHDDGQRQIEHGQDMNLLQGSLYFPKTSLAFRGPVETHSFMKEVTHGFNYSRTVGKKTYGSIYESQKRL